MLKNSCYRCPWWHPRWCQSELLGYPGPFVLVVWACRIVGCKGRERWSVKKKRENKKNVKAAWSTNPNCPQKPLLQLTLTKSWFAVMCWKKRYNRQWAEWLGLSARRSSYSPSDSPISKKNAACETKLNQLMASQGSNYCPLPRSISFIVSLFLRNARKRKAEYVCLVKKLPLRRWSRGGATTTKGLRNFKHRIDNWHGESTRNYA